MHTKPLWLELLLIKKKNNLRDMLILMLVYHRKVSVLTFSFITNSVMFCRELCEESMNHSVSSTSSLDSQAPSEGGCQSQAMRWEEQQKLLALEQLCGVFRVDLGHMRSLRLFFRSAESKLRSSGIPSGSCWTLLYLVFASFIVVLQWWCMHQWPACDS